MKEINFVEEGKIGDKVFDIERGWGIIVSLVPAAVDQRPVAAEFRAPYKQKIWYTLNGRNTATDKMPVLYWNEFTVPEEAYKKLPHRPNFKTDQPLIVESPHMSGNYFRRYFSHWPDDPADMGVYVFCNGKTSWSSESSGTAYFKNWKAFDEECE